jgi:DNA polymerase III epsilon subunit-like protein
MNMAVFDLETNGMAGASVLSASSLVFDEDGVILDVFNRFYLPTERFADYLTNIHGLSPGRLLALRESSRELSAGGPLHFIQDWPDLVDFWIGWDVAGVVVHNLSFDAAFLPEIAQGAFQWWCSMRGLTDYCAIPKRRGSSKKFKWPRLSEAADIVCNGPERLLPPEATEQAEQAIREGTAHVSLFDCFELYRVVTRIAKSQRDLVRFAPFVMTFRSPRKRALERTMETLPTRDRFVEDVLEYERKIRSLIR